MDVLHNFLISALRLGHFLGPADTEPIKEDKRNFINLMDGYLSIYVFVTQAFNENSIYSDTKLSYIKPRERCILVGARIY